MKSPPLAMGDYVVQGAACTQCNGRACVYCSDLGLVPADDDVGLVLSFSDDGLYRIAWPNGVKDWSDGEGMLVVRFATPESRAQAMRVGGG